MRKTFIILSVAMSSLLFVQCSSDSKEKPGATEGGKPTAAGGVTVEKDNSGVCVWDKAVVRETAEDKGKYVTSINMAEKVEILEGEETDESGGKKRTYIKVKLMDGKEGWVLKDLIVANAKAGVLLKDVEIYTRPELVAKSNKMFKRMDIVAVAEMKEDWWRIRGKRSEGTWIDEGWLKATDLSYDEKDIAVALYGKKALSLPVEKQPEELRKIIDNSDYAGSKLLSDLQAKYDELTYVESDGPYNSETETDPYENNDTEKKTEETGE